MIVQFNIKKFLSLWIFFVFTTSFVISNSFKGTTPAFIFSLVSFPLVLLASKRHRGLYLYSLVFLIVPYLILQLFSQTSFAFSSVSDFRNLILVSDDVNPFTRSSLLTQSIYLLCSFLLFVFVIIFYDKRLHEKYLVMSLNVFVSVGLIFWIFFILFGYNGDFISNREYSDGLINPGQFQPILLGNIWISRFVSLTGEPSMYVFSILPYLIYTNHLGYKKTALYILMSLLLTLSGTFITGMCFYVISLFMFSFKKRLLLYSVVAITLILLLFIVSSAFRIIIYEVLISKLLQESDSGLDRFLSIFNHLSFYFNLPFPLMLFGMGFGFIRSPDMFSTLLVNTGITGFILFSTLLLYPVFALKNSLKEDVGVKCGLFTTYFIMMISVSEYSYPSLWLFVGISYLNTPLIKRLRLKRVYVYINSVKIMKNDYISPLIGR